MPSRSVRTLMAMLFGVWAAAAVSAHADDAIDIPGWLAPHVGTADGQIAAPVLQRARSLYLRKTSEGAVGNPCYFAMDATRPNEGGDGTGGRFYVVCEASQSFTAIPAGHGAGRDLKGVADFANGRHCARNFGNALDSELTTGGVYVTGDVRTSFKGYYRAASRNVAYLRSFIQFVGEGETANARDREIGGHAAMVMKGVCLRKDPGDTYADAAGYVPQGTLVDYSGGRSNGCTSWSSRDAEQLAAMVKGNPTTLYIYPEAADIRAVARAAAAGRDPAAEGSYWNATCLREIGAPRYWPRATLETVIAQYKRDHPAPPPQAPPLCRGQ